MTPLLRLLMWAAIAIVTFNILYGGQYALLLPVGIICLIHFRPRQRGLA